VRRLASRDLWTTLAEIAGGLLICAGAFVLFGLGVALAVTGVLLIAAGYLASGGAE
jgi:hypothetical protein